MAGNSNSGRHKITLEDLPEGWDNIILELSKEGASIVELAVALDICKDTFYALSEREPIFFAAVKKCKEHCEVWWLKQGRTNLQTKDFSYAGWYMNMKNRFGWTDRVDTTTKGDKLEPTKITFSNTDDNELNEE